MSADQLVELVREGLFLALLVAAPPVLAAALAGWLAALVQSATNVSEPALGFVPRVVAAALALAVAAPWIGEQLGAFTTALFGAVPQVGP